jgi:multicomponent Na+:H+ antiporter subunit F
MAEFLLAAAALVLLTVALGLARILIGPATVDRMMAAQLLGTGGIAVLCSSAPRRARARRSTSR